MLKFVDQAQIQVQAGKGGHGCLSFRREKYIAFGGPDGGDGGDGGSVYLVANKSINTLAEFRYQRHHKAQNGECGSGRLRTGKSGEDLLIPVPLGTSVYDGETGELIGDMVEPDQRLCVARGGKRGLGNNRFKSSVNRAPRQTVPGELGEERRLNLELKLLADVGLLGMPNAGKSTLMASISNARPKIADYPFTTLSPSLGVVRVGEYQSFVIADIPGLVQGAAAGVGLGIQFLKHLSRTRLLLHLVDIAPLDGSDPVAAVEMIIAELQQFSQQLADTPRWLVLNKADNLDQAESAKRSADIVERLAWRGPVFCISAQQHLGTELLCKKVMTFL